MNKKIGQMNGAVFMVLAGFVLALGGCFAGAHKKDAAASVSKEKVVHIISVEPFPVRDGANASSVNIAYQDTDTMAYEFFKEDKRPCEFRAGEANLIIEKGERTLIMPNATCQMN
ncbi:hypothetical protein FAI40_06940 [Acetobacteraceae bacterium]|nr:hypothetical protein FAI40_06940 [Acetobacteraceae bacterium]